MQLTFFDTLLQSKDIAHFQDSAAQITQFNLMKISPKIQRLGNVQVSMFISNIYTDYFNSFYTKGIHQLKKFPNFSNLCK